MAQKFELPKLEYEYDSLEPHIDEKTMRVHHTKHHQGYTDKFNTALEDIDVEFETAEDVLRNLDKLPEDKKQAIINNGGGYVNHSLFWKILSPKEKEPSKQLKDEIERVFDSIEKLKEILTKEATTKFGSGWAWLVVNSDGELEIMSTSNQDSPLSQGKTPILAIDVWEHAYYLNYQNRRPDYIEAILKIINWEQVSENYEKALKSTESD